MVSSGAVVAMFQALIPRESEPFARAILNSLLEAGEPDILEAWWPGIIETYLAGLEADGRKAEAVEAIQRILRVLEPSQAKSGLVRPLQEWQSRLADASAATPPVRVSQAFQAAPLAVEAPPTNFGHVALSCRRGDELICVWEDKPVLLSSRNVQVHLTSIPVGGGKHRELGRADFPSPVPHQYSFLEHLHSVSAVTNATYVATIGGLFRFHEGGVQWLTEKDGLPCSDVVAVAPYGDKVYLGVGGSAPLHLAQMASDFVEFTPAAGRFNVLAGGRSQQKRNPLDGGAPYTITGMLADTNRQCLWFSLASNIRSAERNGLWRFFPATGRFQQIASEKYSLDRLGWSGGKIVGAEVYDSLNWSGLFACDPDRLELSTLVRTKGYGWPIPRPSLFGNVRTPLWPCALTPAGLLVGPGQLLLLTDATSDPSLIANAEGEPLREVRFLHEVGDRIIAITGTGNFWEVRPGGLEQNKAEATK